MKNLEIPYLLTAYAMGCVIYAINHKKDYLTVSETAAGNKIGRQAFFWGLLVSGILFELLMFRWVIPHYGLGGLFSVLAVLLFIFQVSTGAVPARGKFNNAHLFCAFGLALSMLVLISIFSLSTSLHWYVRVACALSALMMTVLIVSARKISSTKYLRHQNIFFACWHIALFIVVYFG